MQTTLLAPMTATDTASLLASARALRHARKSGHAGDLLKGKNIGLLTETPEDETARLFIQAAQGLGAQVALIRPSHAGLLRPESALATARMLGRLYELIECQRLPGAVVEQLRQHSGIAVLDSQASLEGDLHRPLEEVDEAEAQLLWLQALLLTALNR
ncbi:ornithine carbamoyltransferase [Pelomonas sp. SE-A7]|uniref:ornithine carbamoyltransferase n=1 Tax=Pelomonas sp. SE-A7 TaxID=3054953 RepID=UPI00259C7C7B|nr:ornithine carbamoyltransferase [Pelomonas sp. SE-A7]MDM4767833.1 ornithine carbamoyltransferase [Pelomonas sp. SE-A7]